MPTTDAFDAPDPTDTPLSHVTASIDAGHGDGQFGAIAGATIRCYTCRETFPASHVDADRLTRLEGASDPADMVMVVPITCPHCSTSGSLVLSYGADASAEEADVIQAMERTPAVGQPGSDPTPGITG